VTSYMESKIIFPIFAECKNYTLDPYWIEQFTNFACNKFPPGLKYDPVNGCITIKILKKTEMVNLPPETDIPKFFQTMMFIMKDKLGMRSNRDIKIQKDKIKNDLKQRGTEIGSEFKKIKSKHLKDQLIMDYITSLKQEYDLTGSEYNKLVATIHLAFQFKAFTPGDVECSEGSIVKIEGLEYDESTHTFSIPSYAKIPNKEKVGKVDKFGRRVTKFFIDHNTRVQKYCI
jgi:hypothetical protein